MKNRDVLATDDLISGGALGEFRAGIIPMMSIQKRARAIATASAILLVMSLAPSMTNAQMQATPNTSASPMPGSVLPPGGQMNALTNNPNGSDWLKKFDRQPKEMSMPMPMTMHMPMNGMHGKMSHHMMMVHRMMMNRTKKPSMCMPMPKPRATK